MRDLMRALIGMLLVLPVLADGQTPTASPQRQTPPPDSVFLRAQRLVTEGRGAAGRALVDSVLAARAEGSGPYAEALFWRASLAATAADAERDYRRLAVEFPMSARSEDALLRLAQMELARGDRAMAIRHLERLSLEHPTATARPRASYWTARILFENGDVSGACTALASARASLPASDVELRNEVSYLSRRCAGVPLARIDTVDPAPVAQPASVFVPAPAVASGPAPAGPGARADSALRVPPTAATTTIATVPRTSPETQPVFVAGTSVVPPANAAVTPPVAASAGVPPMPAPASQAVALPASPAIISATVPAATPATVPPATIPPATVLPATVLPAAPAAALPATPSTVPATRPADTVSRQAVPAAAPTPSPARSRRFTVQVAAYDSRLPAEKLAATLVRGGWDARVFGSERPFRVRVGRFATRAEAVAASKALAEKKIVSFVTETEP